MIRVLLGLLRGMGETIVLKMNELSSWSCDVSILHITVFPNVSPLAIVHQSSAWQIRAIVHQSSA